MSPIPGPRQTARNPRGEYRRRTFGQQPAVHAAWRALDGPRRPAPLANDIVSCQLKPLDKADYEVDFTADEWSTLQATFPEGVCDWSKPDAAAEGYQGTWLSFGPSPVNRAR